MSQAEIEVLKKNHVEHMKNLMRYVANFNDLAKCIEEQTAIKSKDYKDQHKEVEKLQDSVKDFIKMIEVTQCNINVLGNIVSQVSSNAIIPDLEAKFKKDVDAEVKKRKFDEAFFNRNENYRNFVSSWWNVHKSNESKPWEKDDDEVVDATQPEDVNVKCPLSHAIMKNPVRNSQCKHVYDRSSVEQYLGQTREKSCPIAGCSKSIRKEWCQDDYQYQVLVERKLKMMEKQTSTQHGPSIDLDQQDEEEIL